MSQSTFPFGASAETESFSVDDEADAGRKPLLLVGGLVGALVLGAGAFLFLGGGEPEEEEFIALPAPQAGVSATEPEAIAVIPAASTESVGRNPFKARYVAPIVAPARESSESRVSDAPSSATPEPLPFSPIALPAQQQQPVLVVQQPAPAPAQTQTHAEYPITLKALTPNDTSGITYTWTIDGKDLDVFQAQRFGLHGELTVLALESAEDGPRAVLQVGDATPIRVKLGETVIVL